MGQFINVGNEVFVNSRPKDYVDKTMLIAEVNDTLRTDAKMSCVTRCRRFGKSMAAAMLCAYYDQSCDSREIFKDLEIAKHPAFEQHLNKYPVIYVAMTDLISKYGHDPEIVDKIQRTIIRDVLKAYPEAELEDDDDLMDLLLKISISTGQRFFMIIDEWDAICREFKEGEAVTDLYIQFLRRLFKNTNTNRVFVGAYITGILPIKKYNTESALNNFWEYTMTAPGGWEAYFGFTPKEVNTLCHRHAMDYEDMKKWYDGYHIGREQSIFNPNSVMQALRKEECTNYWSTTGAFENVATYIQMNFQGLKDDIVQMLAGGRCTVDYGRFGNDLKIIRSRDDVLTVLIHLGYLSYDPTEKKCYVPNLEVGQELKKAVLETDWTEVIAALSASEALMQAVLDGDNEAVAAGVEQVHQDTVSLTKYNSEESLSNVISLAFYTASNHYVLHREYQSGKGFADVVMIPRKHVKSPAIVIELKYNKDAVSAIDQIRQKRYPAKLREYTNNILLVGINYDPASKIHTCKIERDK